MKYHLKTDFRTRPPRVFKRGKSYYIRQRINGKDVWRSLYTANKTEAEAMAYQIWYSQQGDPLKGVLSTPQSTFEVVFEQHRTCERFKLLAKHSQFKRMQLWKNFAEFCRTNECPYPNEIPDHLIVKFLELNNRSNKTFNTYKTELAQVFNDFSRSLKISNPFKSIENKSIRRGEKASSTYRPFSESEILKIFDRLDESRLKNAIEWRSACVIALNTGLRYKDIALLKWSDIKGDFEYIELVPHKTAWKVEKSVYININKSLKTLLKGLSHNREHVLPALTKAYKEKSGTKPFSRYLQNIGIVSADRLVGFHSFRATVVTAAAREGIDLEDFAGVIGHSSKEMTEHYNDAAKKIDLSFLKLTELVAI